MPPFTLIEGPGLFWRRVRITTVALLFAAACRPGVPVVDTGPPPPTEDGTVSGTVRGPGGSSPAANRIVRAIAIGSGRSYEATTNAVGSYTIKLPPGKYRMEVQLLPNERLGTQPGEVDISRSDLDTDQDFVITGGQADRPPGN